MDQVKFVTHLEALIHYSGCTRSAFAKELCVSPQYLGDVLNGRREPGSKILDAVGYERVVSYRKKRP